MFGHAPQSAPVSRLGASDPEQRLAQLRKELHGRLVQNIDVQACRAMDPEELRRALRSGAEELCRNQGDLISYADRTRLVADLVDEALGLGPLEALLRDNSISDILINGPRCVFVERGGILEQTEVVFDNEDHLVSVVQKIASRVGRRIDESSPLVDARLQDGSRVNAVIRPLALDGALVSIRRFASQPLGSEQLISSGAVTREMLDFLAATVCDRV